MNGTKKKAIIRCNYCEVEKDEKQMFTGQKQFAGCKIVDILQIVTHRKIPLSTPIKLCGVCVSTLHTAIGTIERAGHMVSALLGAHKEANSDSDVEEVETTQIKVAKPAAATQNTNKQLTKAKPVTPSKALASPAKQPPKNVSINESTKKQVKELQSSFKENLDQSLEGVIKLTTAKDVSKKKKEVTQLFGTSINHVSDSEDDEEDGDDPADGQICVYECKLCDYKGNFPNKYKRHLRDNHGQKRPRILNCEFCSKSFAVLKTYLKHRLTHADKIEKMVDNETKSKDPQLAVITALKPTIKPKPLLNAEYTFAIKDTNSSTPKPNEVQQQPQQQEEETFQCDVCQVVMNQHKKMQKHLKTLHNIEKPKVFKCSATDCGLAFVHKFARDRHYQKKHVEEQVKPKTPLRRKTIDVRPKDPLKFKLPVSINNRRTTVDGSVLVALDDVNEEETVKAITSPTKSPRKSPTKKAAKEEAVIAAVDLISIESPSSTKKKPKEKKEEETIPLNGTALEESVLDTPGKKLKAKKNQPQDVVDASPMSNGTPRKKTPKRKSEASEVEELSQAEKKPRQDSVTSRSRKDSVTSRSRKDSGTSRIRQDSVMIPPIIELLDEVNKNPLPNRRELLESQDSQEGSDSQLSCSQCSKVVTSLKKMDSHIRKKHTILNCRNCKDIFVNSMEFINHFSNCDASEGLHCGVSNCDKAFTAPNFLTAHLKKKHKLI